MIRRGHYSSNNFQDSTKRKSTEKKILDYLPRVLFFNVFELGAVILKNAHVSAIKDLEAKESIKKQIRRGVLQYPGISMSHPLASIQRIK
jgi:hypothetical protein